MDSTKTTEITPREILPDAKRRFLEEAGKVDFLKPLREHPWATVGSSALAGVVVGTFSSILKSKAGKDDSPTASISTAAPNAASVTPKPSLLIVAQPLLIRGATLAFNWWMARQRAQETEAKNAQETSPEASAQTNPQTPAEPI